MADVATLGIVVDATGAIRGVRDFGNATERTAHQTSILERGVRTLGITLGVYQALRLANDAKNLADAYTNMNSRLSLVTRGAEDLVRVQRELFGISQEARTPLEATANLYERIARNAKALHLAESEVLRVTESVNKAMVISGVSTESARAAMIQLSQGFASGVLRGEELNSVLEQAPRLAQAIADGMGVTVGQLRAMGLEGKLTAEAISRAILSQGEAIDTEFGGIEKTVSGSMTQLRNAVLVYIGEANRASGVTRELAEGISGLANNLDTVATTAQLAGGVLVARYVAGLLAANRESLALRTQVVLGNAVMLDSVQAQRGAAASAVQRAQAQVGASRQAIAAMQQEREMIRQLQVAERQRLLESATRVRRAVPEAQLAPLGGAVQMRDNAQVVLAMKERAAAQEALIALSRRAEVADNELAAAKLRLRTATNVTVGATMRMHGVLVGTTLATRAAAVATGVLGTAVTALGGPIGVAIIGAMALNAWLDRVFDKRIAEADNTPEEMAAFHKAMEAGRRRREGERQRAQETAEEMKRRVQAEREHTSAVIEANAATAATARSADQELALLRLTGPARELHAVAYEAENRLRAEDVRLRVALVAAQGKEGSAREIAIRQAREVHRINRENIDQWKKGQAALIGAADAQERYNARIEAQVEASRRVAEVEAAAESARRKALEKPFLNAIENIQRGWGDMFERVLTEGELTAQMIGGLFKQAGAQLMAGVLMTRAQGVMAGMMGLGGLGGGGGDASLGQTMNREALGGAFAGGVVGYGVGTGIYNSTGSKTLGALGGAASGAAAGFAVAGPIGAATGAIAGFVGGIIGSGKAAKEAAKQMEEAQKALKTNMAALRAEMAGDTLAQAIAQEQARFDALRKQTEEALAGKKNEAERERVLGELNRRQAQRIEQLRAEHAAMQKAMAGDLEVRALRAQGRQAEADALQRQHAQQRELDALMKAANADGVIDATEAALIAQMKYVHGLERTAAAVNDLNGAMAILPSGFKLAAHVFRAMDPIVPTPPAVPRTKPQPGDGSGGGTGNVPPVVVELYLDEAKLAEGVVRNLTSLGAKQGVEWKDVSIQ